MVVVLFIALAKKKGDFFTKNNRHKIRLLQIKASDMSFLKGP